MEKGLARHSVKQPLIKDHLKSHGAGQHLVNRYDGNGTCWMVCEVSARTNTTL